MIDYGILNDSISFYEDKGFLRIESPWTITPATAEVTKPMFATNFTILEKGKVLVASGEQSFLYLYLKGFLPPGQFQTITPCFRDEAFDEWHTKYFIKNELIKTDSTTDVDLFKIIKTAQRFFEKYLEEPVKIIETGESSYDLFSKGIELGSYGIRECSFLKWIYGTGVAEPRFSGVIRYGR